MEKIIELLKQLGGSDELAEQIIQQFNEWKETEANKLEEKFQERLARTKEVCKEHIEGYEKDLARKVEIFLESKVASIERSARERQAIEESEAVNTLKQTKAMLEGIDVEAPQQKDFEAVKSENGQLKRSLVSVTEDRDTLRSKHEKARGIAQSALQRNPFLEQKIAEAGEQTVSEEAKGGGKGTKLESQRPQKGKGKTHRATLTESQVPASETTETQENGEDKIMSIAAQVSEIA